MTNAERDEIISEMRGTLQYLREKLDDHCQSDKDKRRHRLSLGDSAISAGIGGLVTLVFGGIARAIGWL
jgi:hypothetical protein